MKQSEKRKIEVGTYYIERLTFGMLIYTTIGIFFGLGSIISIIAPGAGLLLGLVIGMFIKKKNKPVKSKR